MSIQNLRTIMAGKGGPSGQGRRGARRPSSSGYLPLGGAVAGFRPTTSVSSRWHGLAAKFFRPNARRASDTSVPMTRQRSSAAIAGFAPDAAPFMWPKSRLAKVDPADPGPEMFSSLSALRPRLELVCRPGNTFTLSLDFSEDRIRGCGPDEPVRVRVG